MRIKKDITIDKTADKLYEEATKLRSLFDAFEEKLNSAFEDGKITSLEFNVLECTALYNTEMSF